MAALSIGLRTQRSVLPGFRITLGYTLVWLGLLVLVPLAGLFLKARKGAPAP